MAIEIVDFTHEKWWFSIATLNYQRVTAIGKGAHQRLPSVAIWDVDVSGRSDSHQLLRDSWPFPGTGWNHRNPLPLDHGETGLNTSGLANITYPCCHMLPCSRSSRDKWPGPWVGVWVKAMKSTSIRGLNQTRGICSWKKTLRDINSMHMYIYIYNCTYTSCNCGHPRYQMIWVIQKVFACVTVAIRIQSPQWPTE